MADKTGRQARTAQAARSQKQISWTPLIIVGGCITAVVMAYLHFRFGSTTPTQAAGTAAISIIIFLITYLLFRRMSPKPSDNSLKGIFASFLVALPVFIIAFIGLGWEIPEFADFGAMYILGAWLGSAEAMERAASSEQ